VLKIQFTVVMTSISRQRRVLTIITKRWKIDSEIEGG